MLMRDADTKSTLTAKRLNIRLDDKPADVSTRYQTITIVSVIGCMQARGEGY